MEASNITYIEGKNTAIYLNRALLFICVYESSYLFKRPGKPLPFKYEAKVRQRTDAN